MAKVKTRRGEEKSWNAGTADTFWRTIKKRPRPHRTPGLTFIMFAMSRPRLNPHHLPALPGSGWPRWQSGLALPLSHRSDRARLLFLIRPLSSPFFFLFYFFPQKLVGQFALRLETKKKEKKKERKYRNKRYERNRCLTLILRPAVFLNLFATRFNVFIIIIGWNIQFFGYLYVFLSRQSSALAVRCSVTQ